MGCVLVTATVKGWAWLGGARRPWNGIRAAEARTEPRTALVSERRYLASGAEPGDLEAVRAKTDVRCEVSPGCLPEPHRERFARREPAHSGEVEL